MNSDTANTPKGTVEFRGVSKSYPGVRALRDVSLVLRPGTVTALVGENGAGKSTFIKTMSGAERPDAGQILLSGKPLPELPGQVIDAGISVIYQELTEVRDMSVLDNVLLARQPSLFGLIRRGEAKRIARQALRRVGLEHLPLDRPVGSLSMAQRQLVEIARCLAREATVLVFDEPTSSLPEKDVRGLLDIIISLRDQGITILYVSHHLDEVFELADDIAVLRDGQLIESGPASDWNEARLVRTMLAKELEHAYPWREREIGDVRLRVDDLTAPGIRNASIEVRSGEIVGLIGLAGAGRTELLKAAAGIADRRSGNVTIDGVAVPSDPSGAIDVGVVYAPENRKEEGLILDAAIEDNLTYGLYDKVAHNAIVSKRRQANFADNLIASFGVKTHHRSQAVGALSGGNQQKVVLARAAAHVPKAVFLDDPTRGVDVGANPGLSR